MRISTFLFFLFVLSESLVGQNSRFYTKTDANKILNNSYVNIEFVLENAEGRSFKAPNFEGFTVVSGPSRSSSFTSVNGAISKTMSFGYTLKPEKTGILKIGSAQIISGNQRLTTQDIQIEVIKGSENQVSDQEDIFVTTNVSDSVTNIGQQIILDYKLYTKLDVRSVNFLTEDEFEGFYHQILQGDRTSFSREIVNGTEYYTKSIRKIALFPQQTGTYTIDPVDIQLGIATKNSNRGFFFSSQLIPRRVNSKGLSIVVQNTPTNSGIHESGAVGHYTMKASTAKRSLTTDDAIIVNMQITGNGDSKTVIAPRWHLPENLEMYDPNVIDDQVFPGSKQITHRKSFEYLIVARKPGKYILQPEFSYFSPDSNRYITIKQTLPTINVLQGKNETLRFDETAEEKLEGIFEKTKLKRKKKKIYGSPIHWLILCSMMILALIIVGYDFYLTKTGKRDPDVIRRTIAQKVAKERLSKAYQLKSDIDKKAYYEEIIYVLKSISQINMTLQLYI